MGHANGRLRKTKADDFLSVDCHKLFKQTTIIMSVNNINLSGLTIAEEAPVISGLDIISHELTGAPTKLTTDEEILIHDRIVAALGADATMNSSVVIFMPNKMKTMEVDRRVNVGVTAAGGKIVAPTNNVLTILKGEKTLVVHFIAGCSFDHQPKINDVDETVIGFHGGEAGTNVIVPHPTEDSGDETTLGGDGEETTLEPPTPSAADAESSFESYTGHGFTQEMW